MKKLMLIALLLGAYLFSYGQTIELSPKEVQALKMLRASLFMQNRDEPLYLEHDFLFERNDKDHLVAYSEKNPGTSNPIIGDRYQKYVLNVNGTSSGKIDLFGACERESFISISTWDGNNPLQTSSRTLPTGKWSYHEDGSINAIDLGRSYRNNPQKRGEKIFWDSNFIFGYDEEGHVNEGNRVVQMYKPSNSSENLQEDYKYKELMVTLNYEKDKVTFEATNFRQDGEGSRISKITTNTLTVDGITTLDQERVKTIGKEKESIMERSIKNEYNANWWLTKSVEQHETYLNTATYTYDSNGNILTEINENIDIESQLSTHSLTLSNVYDSLGMIVETTKVITKGDKAPEKQVMSYTYTPIEENTPVTKCKNKQEVLIKYYDQADVLYKESKGQKFRTQEGGVWSEWKFNRM